MSLDAYLICAAVALYWLHDEGDERVSKALNLFGAAIWPLSITFLIAHALFEAVFRRRRGPALSLHARHVDGIDRASKAAAGTFRARFDA
jgi:hypothetical protein